jgi:hypothetical protein
MVVVQIRQPDWGNKECHAPAKQHGNRFCNKHDKAINQKNILTHNEVHDAFVDEPRVGIQQSIDHHKDNHADLDWICSFARREINERWKDQPKHKLTKVVLNGQATEGFCNY